MEFINKKRVLLVDDNPYILKILSMMLELENLEIETANDGTEALNLIVNESKGKFDIIITDFQMPIMDGQELAETLKKYDEYKNLPVILVTQANHISYENDEKYRIFDKILYKPVTKESIIEIKNLLLETG
ncbi:response regulator [Candidatus Aquarickettsia rohweri]|uniref:Response regulator n=1 Tax=Candidatus Aquarickettsia rohweri TaxID=2602574 RepID=A0A3R9XSW6_9RICK|nr:response regulator [Candidatus Aquarickettsia rohweri]MSO13789.1 Sensor histidine kinase RcsC [Rickettsiales endosymbiont of Trichoplax sp. H2]RST64247.1 response regulator [Candidatus Aquarickettsia rohweri]